MIFINLHLKAYLKFWYEKTLAFKYIYFKFLSYHKSLGVNKPVSQIVSIVPSFNNENLALSTETGQIILSNADLTRTFYEYQNENETSPSNMAWCSNQAIVASWDSLMLITTDGETFKYT